MENKKLTRRDFLKGSAATALGAAFLGVSAFDKASVAHADGIYTPGTYSATAQGMGTVTVTMTFDAVSITDVVVDVSQETPTIGALHGEELAQAILAAQGADIDAVSGATITSTAAKQAAEACIAQAKGEAVVLGEASEAADYEIPAELTKAEVEGSKAEL
ncbi:MAG: FMN-binding protein, partial [Bacteroidales bacterium]|nr:FMN-binding protein [Bacteroidales bacterium]